MRNHTARHRARPKGVCRCCCCCCLPTRLHRSISRPRAALDFDLDLSRVARRAAAAQQLDTARRLVVSSGWQRTGSADANLRPARSSRLTNLGHFAQATEARAARCSFSLRFDFSLTSPTKLKRDIERADGRTEFKRIQKPAIALVGSLSRVRGGNSSPFALAIGRSLARHKKCQRALALFVPLGQSSPWAYRRPSEPTGARSPVSSGKRARFHFHLYQSAPLSPAFLLLARTLTQTHTLAHAHRLGRKSCAANSQLGRKAALLINLRSPRPLGKHCARPNKVAQLETSLTRLRDCLTRERGRVSDWLGGGGGSEYATGRRQVANC